MKEENYKQYSVEEWVQDEAFRNYILYQDQSFSGIWTKIESEDGIVFKKIEEAALILREMADVYKNHGDEGSVRSLASYKNLQNRILVHRKKSNRRLITILSAAASVILAILALWTLMQPHQPMRYITALNESKEVLLPDSSLVYLNENSSLIISEGWNLGKREVSLDGEGYFMVRPHKNKTGQKIKFTVKTAGLDIEVLGTQFNVHTRDTVTSVALDEGSIKLIQESKDKKESFLEPGQTAKFNQHSKDISISGNALANKESHWKPEAIEFNQITLGEAIMKMETVFRVQFVTENKQLLNLTIDKLSVPSNNPDVFIKTVNILFSEKATITLDQETHTYLIRQSNKSKINSDE